MTFQISYTVLAATATIIAILLISNVLILRWFLSAAGILRAQRFEDRFREAIINAGNLFGQTIAGAYAKFDACEGRVRSLENDLRLAAERFRDLTPAGVQRALDRKVDIAAEEKAKQYKSAVDAAALEIELYRLWLRALTGGGTDLSKAAQKGYPKSLPDDLAGRLDAWCDQRRTQPRGRDQRRPGGGPEL
jgi:hypothetical protein